MKLPQTPSFRLEGRRALITGASRGIGMGAAVALADAGADVTLAARSASDLEQICDAIEQRGGTASALELDVLDTNKLESTLGALPAFDVLVNNAGVNRPGPMIDASHDDFDTVMDLNVRAAFFVAKTVVRKLLQEKKPGSIINTSSQMGHVGGVDRTIYCASKFALEGMTKALAIETGKAGIRVNTICPTFIVTPLTQATFDDPEKVDWIKSKIKLDRIGEIEDVMGAVVFLASDASALITGSSLMIDGGWTAG